MKLTRLVTVAFILGSASAVALSAQSYPGSTPSEFPPTSYKGKQYVDSKGCVFIRAGIDGNVSWVPRVTRKRTGVCGFKPTFAGEVTPPPEPVQTAAVTQIANPTPAPKAKVTAKPKPKVVAAAPKPKPKVVRQVAQPAPLIVEKAVQPPAPVVKTARVAPEGQTACFNLSPIAQQYMRVGRSPVRCGPQAAPIVGARISSAPAPRATTGTVVQRKVAVAQQPVNVSPNTRIVPRHVAVNRVNTNNVKVPRGYKRVWEDDRLNPHRAEQSLAGHMAMSMIWTSTVPRRLINQANGSDVTASVPLVYPYTDYAQQQRELGEVTIVQRNGQTLKRIVRNVTGVLSPEPRQARVATVPRKPVYSSRSATPKATANRAQPKAEVAGRGYVQVGRFSDAAAAQLQAQKIQRMGLPVRIGISNRDGQTSRLVIAGPFGAERDVNRVISRLRGAGFNASAR
ncbi:SPOR domain-containing protein [Sulfitobacter sp.]|uniref:SPOR domain-containing protein n=1 Tax=Sulfitobacter sp. TaxID=1903071 RepID=UPI00300285E8